MFAQNAAEVFNATPKKSKVIMGLLCSEVTIPTCSDHPSPSMLCPIFLWLESPATWASLLLRL